MERIKKESKLSFFSRKDANEKSIDIKETFSPSPKAITFTAKLFIIATIIWNLTQTFDSFDDDTHVWIYYLTKWGFTLGMTYVVFSTITAFRPSEKLVNITWALFATVMPVQMFVILNYWVLVYDGGNVPFYSIYEHGLFGLLILMDGLVLHRIPIRMKQGIFSWLFLFVYMIWSVIHAFSGIGNPLYYNTDRNDDVIYEALDWKEEPESTGTTAAVLFIIVVPILFFIVFGISLIVPHNYLEEHINDNGDIEEGKGESEKLFPVAQPPVENEVIENEESSVQNEPVENAVEEQPQDEDVQEKVVEVTVDEKEQHSEEEADPTLSLTDRVLQEADNCCGVPM